MSQATFDPTTPGGPSDDSSETRSTRTSGSGARRRPARRGHAANATENVTQTAQTATPTAAPEREAGATPAQPIAQSIALPVAPATPAPVAEEQSARSESRSRRGSRGGAKRPASRGKAGAQLILTKTADDSQAEAAAAESAAQPVTQPSAQSIEHPVAEAAAQPAAAPMIVPVVSSSAEPTTPAEPRKTRFGLPRRFRQPDATPVPAAAPSVATPEPVAEAAPVTPAAVEPVAPTPTEPARRYRFDRSRSTTIPGAPGARPERLSSQRPSLYTEPATELATEPAEQPANESAIDLPSLDSLVSGSHAAELPTLAFDAPSAQAAPTSTQAVGAEDADQLGDATDATDAAELAESAAGASRRRRRRRRGSAAHNGAHGAEMDDLAEDDGQPATDEDAVDAATLDADDLAPVEPSELPYQEPQRETRGAYTETTPAPRGRTGRFGYASRTPSRRAPVETGWDTTPQQPAVETSPYSSPEPAFARGFGPTPTGVAAPVRESYPRPSRIERGADTSAASVAQLGSVIREAISTQTDRLLNELRRQQPPAVTLSIPNAQTAERVGIFVDVANVVYSARGLRTSVDFGHLLDFLRANRRLARAQAYAPTAPEPGAEQTFLSAVKGMGYRITTKNYKTFSNGAKKADLDLDLCMDIVRIVEARAVDTIVLVSGDSDFLPLLDFCSDHGVRVEVAAFDDAASMILRQSCDLFVNLSLVEGIRG